MKNNQFIIYQTEDRKVKIEIHFETQTIISQLMGEVESISKEGANG